MPRPISRRAILVSLPALALARPGSAASTTLRFAHAYPATSPYGTATRALQSALDLMPELAGIQLEHQSHFSGNEAIAGALLSGQLDLVILPASAAASAVPELGLLGVPYLFADTAHAREALDDHLGDNITLYAAARGLHILAWGEHGIRHIAAQSPIRSAADLKNIALTPASPTLQAAFATLGTTSAAPEAFEDTPAALEGSHPRPSLSLTAHAYEPALIAASPALMAGLDRRQTIALNTSAAMAAAAMRSAGPQAQYAALTRLEAAGTTIIRNTDIASIRTALRPYYATLGASFGQLRLSAIGQLEAMRA